MRRTYSLRKGLISGGGDNEALEAGLIGFLESLPLGGLDDKFFQTIFPNVDRSHPAYLETKSTFQTSIELGGGTGTLTLFNRAKDGFHFGRIGYHSLGKNILHRNLQGRFDRQANKVRLLHYNRRGGPHFIFKRGFIRRQIDLYKEGNLK